MMTRGFPRLTLAAAVIGVLASLTGLGGASPALGQAAFASTAAGGPPPPPPGHGYTHAVYSNVTLAGDRQNGQSISVPSGGVLPFPPCWLVPRYHGSDWRDALTYWWWFEEQQPAFAPAVVRDPGAAKVIAQEIKQASRRYPSGWWWAPGWAAGQDGQTCAKQLVSSLALNNGFLDIAPPGMPVDVNDQAKQISAHRLADLARAAIKLPAIDLHTNPLPGRPSEVNLPVWVWVTYPGGETATDSATMTTPVTSETVTVTAANPVMTLAVSGTSSQRTVYGNCGSSGSPYGPGGATTVPRCGVTFLAPSTDAPFTITVTVTWTVTWQVTNPGGGAHGGFGRGWPAPQRTRTTHVTVREIQAINNGG